MEKWKEVVIELNETMLEKMLNAKEAEIPNSDLWRMAAIQIIALGCKCGIVSNLLNALLRQLEHRKRSIVYSASEVIGVLLNNQPENLEDASTRIQAMFSGEAKQDLFVNIVQKISKYQGAFAQEKPILRKLMSFLKPFSASFRACILQSFKAAVTHSLLENNNKVIQEICMCLHAHHEDIITDKDDEFQQSFIILLKELVRSNDKARHTLFKAILDFESPYNVHTIMHNTRNHLTRGLYCDLMVALYTDNDEFKNIATIALIKNIEDPNELIKNKLLIFWSDNNRLPASPTQRLLKMMQNKNMFEDEQTWLKATVWLLLDIVRSTKSVESGIKEEKNGDKVLAPTAKQEANDNMEVDEPPSKGVKEESKSQERLNSLAKDINGSQTDDMNFENSINQASFGQTLEWGSSFYRDSKYYKSYQKDSFLMTMKEEADPKFSTIKNSTNLEKIPEKGKFSLSKGSQGSRTLNLDKVKSSQQVVVPASCYLTGTRKRKIPAGFSKFFEQNDIKRPIRTVGRNNNVRFGPDGVSYSGNVSKLREAKLRREQAAMKHRKAARMQIIMKNRELENKENESEAVLVQAPDMLHPLQSLVLLDSKISSSLFYNLFDSLFEKEPSQEVKDELANTAIKSLEESVACDNATMSSLLLILLKLCKTHRNIDIKAIERVGIKSLNFSKAILLLEELIICKSRNGDIERNRGTQHERENNRSKEWICLKRLHEASDSTGSQNLMLDEFLLIEEDEKAGICFVREAKLGETCNQNEKKELARMYLEQLEKSQKYDEICEELSDEIKHNYYKCKSELLEWESICEDLEPVLNQGSIDT